MESVDLLVKNASELVTLQGAPVPRTRQQMDHLSIIPGGSVAIDDGRIVEVGRNLRYSSEKVIDATGKTVLPGFVDPHTHLVFGGSREFELDMKLKGKTYEEILRSGGGILHTVEATRKASPKQLADAALVRLSRMLANGTTTIEAKSGYGLDTRTEVKMLEVQRDLAGRQPIEIVSTFLGAHAVPPECPQAEYIDIVVEEMLPKVASLSSFCDVFCDRGFFTIAQARRILTAGKKHGLRPKVHADELANTGGAGLAADLQAVSADHLLKSSEKNLKAMATAQVIGVLLPGTPFSLMQQQYAPARKMINLGVPIALATDLNPNCWTENLQFIIQLACYQMRMTPGEAITAATYNAACAIGKNTLVGSLESGKQADLVILDCPSHLHIPYHFGVNHVQTVIKRGRMAVDFQEKTRLPKR
jgi:imidazolonepropionase